MNTDDASPEPLDVLPDPDLGIPAGSPRPTSPAQPVALIIQDARRRRPGDPQPRQPRQPRNPGQFARKSAAKRPQPLSPDDARALLAALAQFDALPIPTDDDRILQSLLGRIVSINLRRLVALVLLPDPDAISHTRVTRRMYARANVLSVVATLLRQLRIDSPGIEVRDFDPLALGTLGQDVAAKPVAPEISKVGNLPHNSHTVVSGCNHNVIE